MGKSTGKPRGRPRGARNRHSVERERQLEQTAREIAATLGLDAFEGDAHALLMLVYKNAEVCIDLRLNAAKAAIGFEKPKLTSVDANVTGAVGHYIAVPVEQRNTDALAGPARPPVASDPER